MGSNPAGDTTLRTPVAGRAGVKTKTLTLAPSRSVLKAINPKNLGRGLGRGKENQMSGSTISTYVTHAVTISPEGYLSPLLITKTGTISLGPSTLASSALKIDDSPGFATITNYGLIQANSGPEDGGSGIGVYSRAKITNHGVIRGGAGYPYVYVYDGSPNYNVGIGGSGIFADLSGENSTILDTGKIYGGSGHLFDGQAGYSGAGVDLSLTRDVKLSVSQTGMIAGGYGGSAYGDIFSGAGVVLGVDTLDNSGLVIGGAGGGAPANPATGFRGANPDLGLIGGIGVLAEGGQVSNAGTIVGGAGGSVGETYGGKGGDGLVGIGATKGPYASIVNHGTIEGGAGGDGSDTGAAGGVGVELAEHSVLTNRGRIIGGAAGIGGVAGSGYAGAGVSMYSAATMMNFGAISAGAGDGIGVRALEGDIQNAGLIQGSDGGDGIFLGSASLVNTGRISGGGKGSVGVYSYGSSTLTNSGTISGGMDAVVLNAPHGHYTSTLIVEKGAVFKGDVVANPADSDTLELSGTSSAALTGIGTQFTGFKKIDFASGAHWTIAGDTAGLASGQSIAGFGPADAITLTDAGASHGSVTVASAGVVTIDAGGVLSKLDIAGATVGETNFKFSNYTLTESAPAMAFLAPPAASAALRPLSILDVLQHFAAAAPAPESFSHAAVTETPIFGASLGPFFAPRLDAVPIVTLHA